MNRKLKDHSRNAGGFTLIELLVYMAIVGVLSSFIYATLDSAAMKGRDAKRVADANTIIHALELYKDQNSVYPPVTTSSGSLSGWEVSFIGTSDFLEALGPYVPGGMMPKDPLNIGPPVSDGNPYSPMFNARPDGSYFYMYYNYGSGSAYGCTFSGPFSVVGFRSFESNSVDRTKLPQASCGPKPCNGGPYPGIDTPRCRDWSSEFDYSVMLVQ